MSQAGLIDIEGSHPQIPTQFDGDSGSAIPVANVLTMEGLTVANSTNSKPVFISASGSTVVTEVQVGAAITGSPPDKNDAGIVSFDDTQFTVDTNGYVQLIGGGGRVDSFTPDDGNVVSADGAGNVNLYGDTVANGTYVKPLYTTGTPESNLVTSNIQVATAVTGAPSDKLDAGIASFDDTYFTVNTDGYVSQTQAGIDTATANYIVDPNGTKAEYTTLATAYAAASSGDIIFIKEGTYTEDLTIDKNISIVGFLGENRPGTLLVKLSGKLTFSGNYKVRIQGISHSTNGDNLIDCNGNDANVWYENCNVSVETAITGYVLDGSGSTGNIYLSNCYVLGTGTAKLFDISVSGKVFWIHNTWLEGFTTASTMSNSTVNVNNSKGMTPLAITGAGRILADKMWFGALKSPFSNTQFLTVSSSNASAIRNSYISSGTEVAITVTSGTLSLTQSTIQSTNGTAVIDGAGTLEYAGLSFLSTSTITTTTQTVLSEGPNRKLSGTGYLQIPAGTTAQQPGSPADGMIRYNSDLFTYEGYDSNSALWLNLAGGVIQWNVDVVEINDDFIGAYAQNILGGGWVFNKSATGSINTIDDPGGHPGIIELQVSATSDDAYGARGKTGNPDILIGNGSIRMDFLIKIPTLFDVTDDGIIKIGLGVDDPFSTSSDYVFFIYDRSTSTNWIPQVASSASTTTASGGSSVAVDTNWTHLRMEINAGSTNVDFWIDGVDAGSATTNIPSTALCPNLKITKNAGSTARSFYIDAFRMYYKLTSNRWS